MALTPAEQAQMAALVAKAAEPEPMVDVDPEPVTVVVEAAEPTPAAMPEMEPETDVVFAAAVAQTLVIEAQADADIRRERATADLREAAEGLAAASGAEQKSRLHGDVFNRKRGARQKNKDFLFSWVGRYLSPAL